MSVAINIDARCYISNTRFFGEAPGFFRAGCTALRWGREALDSAHKLGATSPLLPDCPARVINK
jgi:hypothetical protein